MDYQQALEYLYNSLPEFQQDGSSAYKPGLERIQEFNRYLAGPDKTFCSIHIAGTNGKGSASHILASILMSAGYRVGLYTSPHLNDFRERIKVDGIEISQCEVVNFVGRNMDKMEELSLSFFEMTVAMAFDYFSWQNVEIAIIETGLGGRLDATNIINPIASVITNIGLDHQNLLGDTVEKIAVEKAGIIKKGVPVIIGETDPQSAPIFLERAMEQGAKIRFADTIFTIISDQEIENGREFSIHHNLSGEKVSLELDLRGEYQRSNILTVLSVIELLNSQTTVSVSRRAICEGSAKAATTTGLHGRWEVLGYNPLVVCDTGHNEHGLRQVTRQLAQTPYKKLYMVIGFVSDKDLSKILPLLPQDGYYIFTRPSVNRALPAEELAAQAAAFGLRGEVAPDVSTALKRAKALATTDDLIFVGGSTFVVADVIC